MSTPWEWAQGLPLTQIRPLHSAGSPPCPPPSPAPPPCGIPSFRMGSVQAPTWSPLGCPLPPILRFLDRGTFVWGLDGEQGAFEWLAEDRGHGEGQGQERGGCAWPPAGLQATPDTIAGVGRRACRSQARERVLRGVWGAGQGKAVSRSRLCWGRSAEGGEKGPPTSEPEGWVGG